MGKHGPCYHCGVTSTPLWRNGPPDKPVLCNACGSRWRTKGTLANYTPLHARELLEEGSKVSLERNLPFNPKGHNTHKKKQCRNSMKAGFGNKDYDQNFQRGLDDDSSNGSSSGSAGSYSDSCAHIDDMSEVTGSFQSNMWDSLVPSRRRSGAICSKPSPVEKLTKDLHSILHQQSSYFSSVSSEDLLYETVTPMGSNEIGHGVQLLRKTNSLTKDEESEASSFPIENKLAQSGMPLSVHIKSRSSSFPSIDNEKYSNLKTALDLSVRERASEEKFHILLNKDSLLASINLTDIVNFDGFMRYFTCEEQQQLMKFLPETDNANHAESLRSMFSSSQFEQASSYFQRLLKKGVFDLSFPGMSTEECSRLKEVASTNLTKAKFLEQYSVLKDASGKPIAKKDGSSNMSSLKRSHGSLMSSLSGPKTIVKCSKKFKNKLEEFPVKFPKRYTHEAGQKSTEGTSVCRNKDIFSPRSLSASSHKSCIMDNLELADSNAEQDLLLLDVRSNTSFPEAELLSSNWLQKPSPESFYEESGISEKEGSLCCNSSLSFNSNRLKHV